MDKHEKELQYFEKFQQDFQAENFVEVLTKCCEVVDEMKKKAKINLN